MKREAASCSKMKRLCRDLGIPSYAGIGILESLWHLTAREAPQGDIGKLSDEDIALSIDWDQDEKILINALVESKWLDISEEFRLVVHDWDEHSDDSIDMKLARSGKMYASGAYPRMNKISTKERAAICLKNGWSCEDGALNATTEHNGARKVMSSSEKALPAPAPAPVPEPAKGGAPKRAATPPPNDDSGEDLFPEGLSELQYAGSILESCNIVDAFQLRDAASKAIRLLAKSDHIPLNSSAKLMEERVRVAQDAGETINQFWFIDSKWKANPTRKFEPGTHSHNAVQATAEVIEGRYGQFGDVTPDEMVKQARADGLIPDGVSPPDVVAMITGWHSARAAMRTRNALTGVRQ